MLYPVRWNEDFITRNLVYAGERLPANVRDSGLSYRQLSLFDDFNMTVPPAPQDGQMAISGQF